MNCQKTGRKKAVLDFTNQSSAISSVIWMVRLQQSTLFIYSLVFYLDFNRLLYYIQRNIAEQQKSNFFYNCQCFERGDIQGCENCDSYWKSKINISIVCQGLMLIWIIYSISDNTYQSLVSATAMYLDLFSHINIDIHTVENMF